MLAAQKPTYSKEMEKEHSQAMTRTHRTRVTTTPTPTSVKIFLAIIQSLLPAMETAVQLNRYATNPTGYAEVTKVIIKDILK